MKFKTLCGIFALCLAFSSFAGSAFEESEMNADDTQKAEETMGQSMDPQKEESKDMEDHDMMKDDEHKDHMMEEEKLDE